MPTVRVTVLPEEARAQTQQRLLEAVQDWGLPDTAPRRLLQMALFHARPDAQVVLEHDAALGLLTCEVWDGSTMLFGIDDWLPWAGHV